MIPNFDSEPPKKCDNSVYAFKRSVISLVPCLTRIEWRWCAPGCSCSIARCSRFAQQQSLCCICVIYVSRGKVRRESDVHHTVMTTKSSMVQKNTQKPTTIRLIFTKTFHSISGSARFKGKAALWKHSFTCTYKSIIRSCIM